MPDISLITQVGDHATSGMVVSAYKASRFGSLPVAYDTAAPGGAADATATSGNTFGGIGQVVLTVPTFEEYWISMPSGGHVAWVKSPSPVVPESDVTSLIADLATKAGKGVVGDGILYVSTAGDDANDGLSWGSAKLTISAALGALTTEGTVRVGSGVFVINSADSYGNGLTLTQQGTVLRGAGQSATTIKFTSAMTWGIKLAAQQCRVEGFRIETAAGATLTYGIGISPMASPGGCQLCSISEVYFYHASGNTLTAGIAVGPEFPGSGNIDTANTVLDHCSVACATAPSVITNGYLFGNGTSGNVLENWANYCTFTFCYYGVTYDGGSCVWSNGGSTGNQVDFHFLRPCGDLIQIAGHRGENGNIFIWAGYSGAGDAVLSDCYAGYYVADGSVAGAPSAVGAVINWNFMGSLTLLGGCYSTALANTKFILNQYSGTPPRQFVAIGVMTDNDTAYPAASAALIRTIISATNNGTPITGMQHVIDGEADFTGAVTVGGLLTLVDAVNIPLGTTTGSQIGTATAQKLALHGATPVIQRAGAAQVAAATTGSTNTTPYGFTTSAQANAIVTLLNEIRAALVEKGIIKGAA